MGADIRHELERGCVVDFTFEPSNGTRYGLIFTPLSPRLISFLSDEKVCRGIAYDGSWVLVYRDEDWRAHPFQLLGGVGAGLAWPYVGAKLALHPVDAHVIARLFCAIAQVPLEFAGTLEWEECG